MSWSHSNSSAPIQTQVNTLDKAQSINQPGAAVLKRWSNQPSTITQSQCFNSLRWCIMGLKALGPSTIPRLYTNIERKTPDDNQSLWDVDKARLSTCPSVAELRSPVIEMHFACFHYMWPWTKKSHKGTLLNHENCINKLSIKIYASNLNIEKIIFKVVKMNS